MVGAVLLILAMLLFPIGIFVSGAAVAAISGWLHTGDAERRHAGSDLLRLGD